MKERPILFSAPMVRAILEGRKTQTRRALRKQFVPDAEPAEVPATSPEGWQINGHSGLWWDDTDACIDDAIRCPYGQPGDRLWVREAFMHEPADYCWEASVTIPVRPAHTIYRADSDPNGEANGIGWKPSIHMPRWASRILLEITAVRVERLQDISEEDALAEGVTFKNPVKPGHASRMGREAFAELWESINGPDSWEENPWVWVIEFKRVTP